MAQATYAIGNFTGGEISAFAQGRFDKPDYHTSLKVCLNAFPAEIGPWTRRPGTRYAGHSRGGAPARVIEFDFQQSSAVTIELSDGIARFRNGPSLITGNDTVALSAVSAANPAVVQTALAVTWSTGNTLIFPGASTPLLENRQFKATKVDTTHFSLADALTGATIDGSTLGTLAAGATVARVQELVTPYIGGSWATVRMVQAETTGILLQGGVPPQALTVPTLPDIGVQAQFALAPAIFNDGPYLDPFTNGVQATPNAKSGIVSLSLSFPLYSATTAYAVGAFVTSAGVNYVSLVDQNAGHAPVSSPAFWATTSTAAAINGGRGFLGTDIGRLIRLFSEPAAYDVTAGYTAGNIVAYNPSGLPGATTYWQSLTTNTGKPPGSDLTNWSIIASGAALWSWGKITGLSNVIDRTLAGSTSLGDMALNGGINAVFNGSFSQLLHDSAAALFSTTGFFPARTPVGLTSFVGKNYSGASDQQIQQATVYPSTDNGFAAGVYVITGVGFPFTVSVAFNLRGSATPPASPSSGTLLGTSGIVGNSFSAVTIVSNDQVTAYKYVWVEQVTTALTGFGNTTEYFLENSIAQVSFFSPTGTGTNSGCTVEILGPALLYTAPIATWRLGVYSDTTGYPTCGVYNDGRLFLGGAFPNRFDASVANGIVGGTINFAPTDQYGAVSAANAISYTFNSDGVNPILWMKPDLQGVLMGTQAGEWLVQAPTAGPIAPANITARNVTNHGGAFIQPCRTEHTTIFVQRFSRKLLEYFPDVFSGKFSAPNLADKAEHLTSAGVAELAYTSAVTPIVWGRDALGALFGITYKRDSLASSQPPTFYGWHRHALGSGRTVESICSGPSIGGNLDALTLVTSDGGVRHVEVLTDAQNELSALANAWFLDDAVAPTSTTPIVVSADFPYGGITLNGLWHLNGKTVQVFAGGLDVGAGNPAPSVGHALLADGTSSALLADGVSLALLSGVAGGPITDFVVTNGSISIPYGDGVAVGAGNGLFTSYFMATNPPIVVGFTYNSDGQLVRPITPAESGARNGPAFAKLSRGHRYGMLLVNTLGLSVGGDLTKKLYPALFKTPGNKDIPAITTFSGVHQDSLRDDYGYDGGTPAWRVSRPFPATVVIVATNLSTQDQ